jgi:hypothetical protein
MTNNTDDPNKLSDEELVFRKNLKSSGFLSADDTSTFENIRINAEIVLFNRQKKREESVLKWTKAIDILTLVLIGLTIFIAILTAILVWCKN